MHRHIGWAVLLSECGHVFCCVLPTIFTALSFAANIGLIAAAPGWVMEIHERIHEYEMHIVVFSGVILLLGWVAYLYGEKIDCHSTGCVHPPCDTKKNKNKIILVIASCLFAFNLFVYLVVHKNVFDLPYFPSDTHIETEHNS